MYTVARSRRNHFFFGKIEEETHQRACYKFVVLRTISDASKEGRMAPAQTIRRGEVEISVVVDELMSKQVSRPAKCFLGPCLCIFMYNFSQIQDTEM